MSYRLRLKCENCGAEREVEIPYGVEIKDVDCPVCGCKTLERPTFSYAEKVVSNVK